MPDREKFTPPDVTPQEAEAQSIIRKLLDLLKTVKMLLELIYSRLPDPPDAEDMGEGRIPESLTFSLRSSIECALVDHLNPLIRSLRRAAKETPQSLLQDWQRRQKGSR